MENDRNYFMRRAAQERSAEIRATDHKVRKAHRELAERYEHRVHDANGKPADVAA